MVQGDIQLTRAAWSAAIVFAVLALAGCAAPGGGRTGGGGSPGQTEGGDKSAVSASDYNDSARTAAVRHLLASAEQASRDGDNDRAAGQLERALRIEPRNAVLWHNLAIVRYRQGNYAQAESLALRAESFSQGDTQLRLRNWRLIAAARQERGDIQGARAAREKAERIQSGENGR